MWRRHSSGTGASLDEVHARPSGGILGPGRDGEEAGGHDIRGHDIRVAGAGENGRGEGVHEGALLDVVSDRTLEVLALRDHDHGMKRRRARVIRRSLLAADVVTPRPCSCRPSCCSNRASAGISTRGEIVGLGAVLLSWLMSRRSMGSTRATTRRSVTRRWTSSPATFAVVTVVELALFVVSSLGVAQISAARVALSCVLASILVPAGRAVACAYFRRRLEYLDKTVIVGAGRIGQLVARKLLEHPEYGLNVVGFVDAQPKERRHDLKELTLLGPPGRLPAIIDAFRIERVIIAFSDQSSEQILELLRPVKRLDVQIDIVPRLVDLIGPRVAVSTVGGMALVGLPPVGTTRLSTAPKRAMDLFGSLILLLLLAPALAFVAVLVKLDSRGPVVFYDGNASVATGAAST